MHLMLLWDLCEGKPALHLTHTWVTLGNHVPASHSGMAASMSLFASGGLTGKGTIRQRVEWIV
jgi:hypothetical protein